MGSGGCCCLGKSRISVYECSTSLVSSSTSARAVVGVSETKRSFRFTPPSVTLTDVRIEAARFAAICTLSLGMQWKTGTHYTTSVPKMYSALILLCQIWTELLAAVVTRHRRPPGGKPILHLPSLARFDHSKAMARVYRRHRSAIFPLAIVLLCSGWWHLHCLSSLHRCGCYRPATDFRREKQ